MKYMGSKGRHAKELIPILTRGRAEGQFFVEPFVGGANVLDKIDGNRIGADSHPHLIAMLQAASEGWEPPRHVSESYYHECADLRRDSTPHAIVGYVGFAMSYGGKWFGGYRRDKSGKRDYADEAYRGAMKQFPKLRGVKFVRCDYRALEIPAGSIIYCDPPYQDTTKYATGDFDHVAFWKWCDEMHEAGHTVYVSEYRAPPHWRCVWTKKVHNTLVEDTGAKVGIEKLFTR